MDGEQLVPVVIATKLVPEPFCSAANLAGNPNASEEDDLHGDTALVVVEEKGHGMVDWNSEVFGDVFAGADLVVVAVGDGKGTEVDIVQLVGVVDVHVEVWPALARRRRAERRQKSVRSFMRMEKKIPPSNHRLR